MYYLRTKPAANPVQFTVDKTKLRSPKKEPKVKKEKDEVEELAEELDAAFVCARDNPEGCMACSA